MTNRCVVCGREYSPRSALQTTTCGDAACMAERRRHRTKARQGVLRAKKRALREAGAMPATEHGIAGYTSWACRCEVCRVAWRWYLRARRAKGKRDRSLETRRRLYANLTPEQRNERNAKRAARRRAACQRGTA